MKRKNICAEAALREVARKNHTTVEEVRKEIRLAMIAAMCIQTLPYRKDGTRFLMLATHSRRRISLHMLQVSVVKNGITHFHSGSIRSFAYSIVIACS